MYKIWHKFFLLAVLSFLPLVSQAQNCITPSGYTLGAVSSIPMPDGIQVTMRLSFTIQSANCIAMPTPISPLGIQNGSPQTFSQNGLTVNINDTKLILRQTINCVVSGSNSKTMVFASCNSGPQLAVIDMVYTVKGKSTTTASNIKLFNMQLTTFPNAGSSSGSFSSAGIPFNVPASTAPTCGFLIDQPNLTLQSIKPADIENLTAGTAVAAGQKNVNITVSCDANALSANATFVPQFSPTKRAVLTGSSHVALNDGTDNGTGFKLFDPSGAAIPFNTPLSAFSQSLYAFTPALRTSTKAFTIKYAKTSKTVTAGPVSSSITVTFSLL
jgi:type 1 fimbria pilin